LRRNTDFKFKKLTSLRNLEDWFLKICNLFGNFQNDGRPYCTQCFQTYFASRGGTGGGGSSMGTGGGGSSMGGGGGSGIYLGSGLSIGFGSSSGGAFCSTNVTITNPNTQFFLQAVLLALNTNTLVKH
jgi:hypothetical protein